MPDPTPVPSVPGEIRLKGIPVSPGVAIGPVVVFHPDQQIVRRRKIKAEDVPNEIARLEAALIETRKQIQNIRERLSETLGERDASVFDAHLLVVEDVTLIESVKKQLSQKLLNVEFLYQQMTQAFAQRMREVDDEYLRERANDIVDVGRRVLRNLQGVSPDHTFAFDTPSIIFSHDLTPSDTAMFDRKQVLGFVTEVGSRTSHTAIMARSLNLPAVVGLRHTEIEVEIAGEALVDGIEGLLILNPTDQTKFEYGQIETRRHQVEEKLESLRETIAITLDQRRIIVSANVELPEDLPLVKENGAEGIGLYRTEFVFLNRDDYPDEEEQYQIYRKAAEAAKPHSVILRTLDVGGDKFMPHLGIEPETNPFLGWRGVRYCLGRLDVFRTQLRAILRASTEGNVRIMFPMVTEISELRACRKLVDEVSKQLRKEKIPIADRVETGVMIEVPSAAMTADVLAREVDFFSIGTNDLIQYTLAVDRGNERVSSLYQPTHPAVLRLIYNTVEAAHRHRIWVGVCGEMASDIVLTPLLVGLGVDELSLGSVFVPRIKRAVQALSFSEAQSLAQDMLTRSTAQEILDVLQTLAEKLYPEIL